MELKFKQKPTYKVEKEIKKEKVSTKISVNTNELKEFLLRQ